MFEEMVDLAAEGFEAFAADQRALDEQAVGLGEIFPLAVAGVDLSRAALGCNADGQAVKIKMAGIRAEVAKFVGGHANSSVPKAMRSPRKDGGC